MDLNTKNGQPVEVSEVGGLEMRVVASETAADSDEQRLKRVEALTAWLLAEWQREQSLRSAECGPDNGSGNPPGLRQ
jgi:hypothetical protein